MPEQERTATVRELRAGDKVRLYKPWAGWEGVRRALCECVRHLLDGDLSSAWVELRDASFGFQQLGIEA